MLRCNMRSEYADKYMLLSEMYFCESVLFSTVCNQGRQQVSLYFGMGWGHDQVPTVAAGVHQVMLLSGAF